MSDKEEKGSRRLYGIAILLFVSLDWVAFSYIVKSLESSSVSPFILTVFSNSLNILFLPLSFIKKSISKKRYALSVYQKLVATDGACEEESKFQENKRTSFATKHIIKFSFIMGVLFWMAQFIYNTSLKLTSVMSNTILSSSSSIITFFLSVAFLNEKITLHKLTSLGLSLTGTLMVIYADSKDFISGKDNLFGDVLVILSCIIYAIYSVLLKKLVTDEDSFDMFNFFGYIGLFIFTCLGIPTITFGLLRIVNINMSASLFAIMIFKGLFDNVLTGFLFAKALLYLGPTIATVCLSMQWPFTIIIDLMFYSPQWLHETVPFILMTLGILLILLGFLGINLSDTLLPIQKKVLPTDIK